MANADGVCYFDGTRVVTTTVGSAGQVLQSSGAAVAPAYSTATYPLTTAQGDLLSSTAANTVVVLAKDANATRYLSNTGANNNAAWAQVNLANGITAALPIANGGLTRTAVPSFYAKQNQNSGQITGDGTVYPYICNFEFFDAGGDYSTVTGVFTAPITGKYLFLMKVFVRFSIQANAIESNIVTTSQSYMIKFERPASTLDFSQSQVIIASMTAGDTAYPTVASFGEAALRDYVYGNAGDDRSSFGGYLMSV